MRRYLWRLSKCHAQGGMSKQRATLKYSSARIGGGDGGRVKRKRRTGEQAAVAKYHDCDLSLLYICQPTGAEECSLIQKTGLRRDQVEAPEACRPTAGIV